ncbi:hypothetical protein LI90_319 [Carbonactinospora thermoautotrophica]|uniref:Mannosyl-oligosaccharide alpha-1,2-mannosidase n=2 Tax=Carbonactinospora thermoautotrophica TaxID=1469144 RepID=A0A132MMN9_9ACTN|nr:glycoside hydrolase family 47 protein [Carbonactinospora thermoautotrophica]KWW98691.1 hypothetical protein LI90_319 [Carbonactinospora thermoautotrophica]
MGQIDRAMSLISRRGLLGALTAAGALTSTCLAGPAAASPRPADRAIADEVRGEFLHAWNAYRRLAWGHDELLPLTGSYREFFAAGHPVGLTIVESLDTLYLMELDEELDRAVRWCENNLDFDIEARFQVFETVIRMVGGLLSGYHATGSRTLLDLARDLADRLLPAFDSPTGAPYRFVNLRTGEPSGPDNFLAEIGTNIAEFGELTRLTGDPKYYQASKQAYQAVVDRRSRLDLLGAAFDVETGAWQDTTATLDPPVDSFFEYLWDGWRLFGDQDLLAWYRTLSEAIFRYQRETYGGHLWFKRVDYATGKSRGRVQSELTSFYAGLLAESGYPRLGARYHDSWTAVARRYPILPELVDYTTFAALNKGNELRPEYVDAAFHLWLKTGEEVYRDRAYDYFLRVKRHQRVANGYTIARDVTTTPVTLGNLTSAYWFSENMKYYYLMFADSPRFDYQDNYLTTEGNVLRGIRR